MNRHQRRALEKKPGLKKALDQIQQATANLEGYQALPTQLQETMQLMKDAHATVGALVDDYQAMSDEIEALKSMVFGLVGIDPVTKTSPEVVFNQALNRIRSERSG